MSRDMYCTKVKHLIALYKYKILLERSEIREDKTYTKKIKLCM